MNGSRPTRPWPFWPMPPRRPLALLTLALAAGPAAAAADLREALAQAWALHAPARAAESRRLEAQASAVAAAGWLADSPVLSVAERGNRFRPDRGQREREIELALPLWQPGQRAARQALAAREADDAEATVAAARLALAGELRSVAWALAAARDDASLAASRLATAERLADDVARREAAGDLARTDRLLAQDEALAARAALVEARGRERQERLRWRMLTGDEAGPGRADEPPAEAPATPHPLLQRLAAEVERARAELRVAGARWSDAPELSLSWQRSREDGAAPSRDSLRVGLRLTLDSEVRAAPRQAAAQAALQRSEAELDQARRQLEIDQQAAREALGDAERGLADATLRSQAAQERLSLLERAFALGELPLAELLRARGALAQARLDASRAQSARGAARARVNQTLGVLP